MLLYWCSSLLEKRPSSSGVSDNEAKKNETGEQKQLLESKKAERLRALFHQQQVSESSGVSGGDGGNDGADSAVTADDTEKNRRKGGTDTPRLTSAGGVVMLL